MKILNQLVNLGTFDDRDYFDQSTTRTLNKISLLAFLIISFYIINAILTRNWPALVLDLMIVVMNVFILYFNARQPGSGIGLSICRKVVQNHGGEIWFDSVLGEGSCFCFTANAGVLEKVEDKSVL